MTIRVVPGGRPVAAGATDDVSAPADVDGAGGVAEGSDAQWKLGSAKRTVPLQAVDPKRIGPATSNASTQVLITVRKAMDQLEAQLAGLPPSMRQALRQPGPLPDSLQTVAKQMQQVNALVDQQLSTLPPESAADLKTLLAQNGQWPNATPGVPALQSAPAFGGVQFRDDIKSLEAQLAATPNLLQQSPGFQALDEATRTKLKDALEGDAPATHRLKNLVAALVSDPRYGAADSAHQQLALFKAIETAESPKTTGALMTLELDGKLDVSLGRAEADLTQVAADLRGSEAWKKLTPLERDRLLLRLEDPEMTRALDATFANPKFAMLTADAQATFLNDARAMFDAERASPPPSAADIEKRLETSAGFRALDPAARALLQSRIDMGGGDYVLRQLDGLMGSSEWSRASGAAQAQALLKAVPSGAYPTPARTSSEALHQALEASPGWSKLTAAEHADLRRLGNTRVMASNELWSMSSALQNPVRALRTPDEEAQGLRDLLSATRPMAPTVGQDPTVLLPADALAQLRALPGYAGLEPVMQQRLTALLSGPTNALSYRARSMLPSAISALSADPPRLQTQGLRELVQAGAFVPPQVLSLVGAGTDGRFKLGEVKRQPAYDFMGAKADANVLTVKTRGHTIQVVYPSAGVGEALPSPTEVGEALSRLPDNELKALKRVVLNTVPDPQNADWEKQYGIANFQAAAAADSPSQTVFVFPVQYPGMKYWTADSLLGTLRHEVGHVLDPALGHGGFDVASTHKDWVDARTADGIYPSQYAMAAQAEDTAETHDLWDATKGTPAHEELRAIFPNTFRLLDVRGE